MGKGAFAVMSRQDDVCRRGHRRTLKTTYVNVSTLRRECRACKALAVARRRYVNATLQRLAKHEIEAEIAALADLFDVPVPPASPGSLP